MIQIQISKNACCVSASCLTARRQKSIAFVVWLTKCQAVSHICNQLCICGRNARFRVFEVRSHALVQAPLYIHNDEQNTSERLSWTNPGRVPTKNTSNALPERRLVNWIQSLPPIHALSSCSMYFGIRRIAPTIVFGIYSCSLAITGAW